jgi:hypothetical protein
MQRFVLRENISRFRGLLAAETDLRQRAILRSLTLTAERELAVLDAAALGAEPFGAFYDARGPADRSSRQTSEFADLLGRASENYLLLDPRPGLHIIDLNDAYANTTMVSRAAVVGERLFEVFPDNPDDPEADGVSNLFRSLQIVAETKRPHAMPILRYDVRDNEGQFVTRYWRPINTPLFSNTGALVYILHQAEDVTNGVALTRPG